MSRAEEDEELRWFTVELTDLSKNYPRAGPPFLSEFGRYRTKTTSGHASAASKAANRLFSQHEGTPLRQIQLAVRETTRGSAKTTLCYRVTKADLPKPIVYEITKYRDSAGKYHTKKELERNPVPVTEEQHERVQTWKSHTASLSPAEVTAFHIKVGVEPWAATGPRNSRPRSKTQAQTRPKPQPKASAKPSSAKARSGGGATSCCQIATVDAGYDGSTLLSQAQQAEFSLMLENSLRASVLDTA